MKQNDGKQITHNTEYSCHMLGGGVWAKQKSVWNHRYLQLKVFRNIFKYEQNYNWAYGADHNKACMIRRCEKMIQTT